MVTPANSRKAGGGRLIHHRARYTPCRLFTSAGSPAGQTCSPRADAHPSPGEPIMSSYFAASAFYSNAVTPTRPVQASAPAPTSEKK
ncbi:hypothetical protein FA137_28875 [Pseudomonas aeruginosa]|nr:hypothetical protein [Pseudomonas aeruginosa]MWW60766.1 hypothetical protein [Pseudomonas aeruginosa]OPD87702.1 hypothetical protein AO968_33785 [Pseudomonas aeruginosa]